MSLRTVFLAFVLSLTLVIALVCANSPLASAATQLPHPHQQAYEALAKGQNPAIITLLGSPEESHFSQLSLSDEQLCENLVSASEGKPNQIVSANSSATLQTGASAVDRFSQAQVEATAQAGPLVPEVFAARLQKCTLPGQYAPLSAQQREEITSKASATADEAIKKSAGSSTPLSRHELHYCVATKGNVSESLEQFENKIFRTLNSPEGWPRAGVTFRFANAQPDTAQCDFTLWLSQATLVPSFS
ncbi:MAG: hypothetical protein Q4G38_04715, partial [Aeriscardovia aeriphila]|nr:hypothetical protein [Aeriscardovia aeriphila]